MASELDRLRAEVRRRHAAATAKVSRLRSKGVEVGGSEFDVRRDPHNIKRYTRNQLNSYMKDLNGFTNRSTQFVGTAGGPVPADVWKRYKTVEGVYNKLGEAEYRNVRDIKLHDTSMTIEDRDRDMLPKRKRSAGEAIQRIYEPVSREPSNINGSKAIERLTKQLENRTKVNYKPSQLRKSRKQFMDMINDFGDPALIKEAKGLSSHQFNIVWNYTSFATDTSRTYEHAKAKATKAEDIAHDSVVTEGRKEISDVLQWAKLLPRNP